MTARVSGDARTLRVTDCSSAPAAPRAKPTATPANRRGSREPVSTSLTGTPPTLSCAPVNRRSKSRGPTPEVPWVRCHSPTATIARTRTARTPAPAAVPPGPASGFGDSFPGVAVWVGVLTPRGGRQRRRRWPAGRRVGRRRPRRLPGTRRRGPP